MVYPEQMNQPTWVVGQLNHTEAVSLAHCPQWFWDGGIPESSCSVPDRIIP